VTGYGSRTAEILYEPVQYQNQVFGESMQTRIKEYRTRLNLTQEDLAKTVGVRRETIVFLEQGKYNPSLKLAHDVARALHSTIDDLFIFEEDGGSRPGERTVLVD
jgi:putative transcriptional regulator